MWKALAVVLLAVAVGWYICPSTPVRPTPPTDKWFGPGQKSTADNTEVREFKVEIPDEVLDDLVERIGKTRLGRDLENSDFGYGFQVGYMKKVIDHWLNKFDWRKQEAILNQFPQFKTKINGLDIHFIHAKPAKSAKTVLPLLMVHGWPGSVWEFYKILPLLTQPDENQVAFEVICPSIPGYGFSESPHQKGFDGEVTAVIFRKLMLRLGHERFYVQGGDWGSLIIRLIATIYPQNVIGLHTNMATPPQSAEVFMKELVLSVWPSLLLTDTELANWKGMGHLFKGLMIETGYFHLQVTRPDTPAFALNDSPVGLAAYIMEKFAVWTHSENKNKQDGGIEKFFTLDEVLTNVMIYWVSGNIGPSMRYYKENVMMTETIPLWQKFPVTVPAGIAAFRHDLIPLPKTLSEVDFTNLVHYSDIDQGGHFAALQEPKRLADDFRAFVKLVQAMK